MLRRFRNDPAVKLQPVRTAVQRQHRLVRAHLRLQRVDHLMPDVWRVGDDQLILPLAEASMEIRRCKQIALDKLHALAAVCRGIFFGDRQGLRAHIRAGHLCALMQLRNGNADCAAAAAEVQDLDTSAKDLFIRVVCAAQLTGSKQRQRVLDHRLRILPRDQHVSIDGKRQSHELLRSGDMLQRYTRCAFLHQLKIRFTLVILQDALPRHHQAGAIEPLHIAIKLFRVDCRVGNPRVGKHLFSDADHFL